MNSLTQAWTQRRNLLQGDQMGVLVVDDHREAADALATYLSLENMSCRAAYSGKSAIQAASTWRPHVIIMDISMPDFDGFEATLALRADPNTSHIVIVAFTALDETEVLRHLASQEFDGYCQKGQSPNDLITLLLSFVT